MRDWGQGQGHAPLEALDNDLLDIHGWRRWRWSATSEVPGGASVAAVDRARAVEEASAMRCDASGAAPTMGVALRDQKLLPEESTSMRRGRAPHSRQGRHALCARLRPSSRPTLHPVPEKKAKLQRPPVCVEAATSRPGASTCQARLYWLLPGLAAGQPARGQCFSDDLRTGTGPSASFTGDATYPPPRSSWSALRLKRRAPRRCGTAGGPGLAVLGGRQRQNHGSLAHHHRIVCRCMHNSTWA